jgi:transposase
MTMLAEVVDAVIGTGTHRDTHEAEIADAAGKPIAVMRIGNDSAGFARLLAAIAEVAPGPRVAVCIEGSRSYGIGLARALAAAGLLVIECEQPSRRQRRGKGKSDPIDAHLAVLAALRLDADRLPVPRADGDREALRILLVARQEITEARTAQAGRLRALLPAGDDTDRQAARTTLSGRALAALAAVSSLFMPAASRPSGRPRSVAWRTRSARPGGSSRTTAPSCWPSSMTSLPG